MIPINVIELVVSACGLNRVGLIESLFRDKLILSPGFGVK